jgi:hypothetical protein
MSWTNSISWSWFWSHEKLQFRSHDHNFGLVKKLNFDLMKFDLLIISLCVGQKISVLNKYIFKKEKVLKWPSFLKCCYAFQWNHLFDVFTAFQVLYWAFVLLKKSFFIAIEGLPNYPEGVKYNSFLYYDIIWK